MYRDKSKLLPIILVVVIAAVAIIAMVSLGRAILNRGEKEVVTDDPANRALVTTDTDRSVRMSVRGPIVADEEFRSYDIEISPIGRRMTVYEGYEGKVLNETRLSNNEEAYAEFVNALSRAQFTSEGELSEEVEDIEGLCANGRLYTFKLLQSQSVVKELWTSSCREVRGIFAGDAVQIRNLFHRQIPESRELLRGVDLSA